MHVTEPLVPEPIAFGTECYWKF